MMKVIYFSSTSNNTERFVEKLSVNSKRIPLLTNTTEPLIATEPYILITPTYGGGNGKGAVPKQVIKFLNHKENRDLLKGVISTGNTNFGAAYCLAGDIISNKCEVPHLYKLEIMGMIEDVNNVKKILEEAKINASN